MKKTRNLLAMGLLTTSFALYGCMSWSPGWEKMKPATPGADISSLLKEADRKSQIADNKTRLMDAIETYETVLEGDPTNYRALSTLGHLYILMGAAYEEGASDKKHYYRRAIHFNEKAMYTNNEFKQLVDRGEPLWEASRVLTIREMDPMGYWMTAVFYTYKESLGPIGRIINYKWIQRTKKLMDGMMDIDPDWADGGLYFSLAIYYLALPERVGGDKGKSEEYMAKAIEAGPNNLLNRWGRARYYHVLSKDRSAFKKDLEWVIAQNPKGSGIYAWNVHFQRQARQMLKDIDDYF
jgi:tetratricopeptide (TPR) repeat protein